MLLQLPNELLIAITAEIKDFVALLALAEISPRTYAIAMPFYEQEIKTFHPQDPLLKATYRGCTFAVETLLKQRKDPASKWMRGISKGYLTHNFALLHAVEHGQMDIARLLLEHGTNPETRRGRQGTVLQFAACIGNPAMAQLLLSHGADPNATGGANGFALRAAAQAGHLEVIKVLLDGGAKVNMRHRRDSATALQSAVRNRHNAVAMYLLSRGADDNEHDDDDSFAAGKTFRAALDVHQRHGNMEILTELVSRLEVDSLAAVNSLASAAKSGDAAIVNLLLHHGIDITKTGVRALGIAARAGHLPILKILIAAGANINGQNHTKGTALLRASIAGHTACVSHLLAHGALVNITTPSGARLIHNGWSWTPHFSTALQAACWHDHTPIAQLLLDAGADPNTSSAARWFAPLNLAAYRGNIALVRLLLDAGADASARGQKYADTALQAATQRRRHDIVQLLLDRGARIDGSGALQNACGARYAEVGDVALVRLLLARGADPNERADAYAVTGYISAMNGPGEVFVSALEVARRRDGGGGEGLGGDAGEIVELLLQHGAVG